uniref:Uncharacterized protein n=1 Tax=viral metagenome TaxID=1070528 RepID=A0A6H1Z9J4_9ZZZZ
MKFDTWFEKQFGKEPDRNIPFSKLWDRADSLRHELRIIEDRIANREKWIAARKVALYTWNIKEEDKK